MTYTIDSQHHTITCEENGLTVTVDTLQRTIIQASFSIHHGPAIAMRTDPPSEDAKPIDHVAYAETIAAWNAMIDRCPVVIPHPNPTQAPAIAV